MNNTQTAQLAYALGKYLQRNYDESAKALATLNESSVSVESQALLQLMRGNSLIFRNSYTEAVEAYQQAVTLKPDWAGAYHNLGVAQMNQAWETSEFSSALNSFSQTLRLDPNFSLSYITIGELWRWKGIVDGSPDYLNQAENDCQLAITSSEPHIVNYATVCLKSIQVTRYALSPSTTPPDINESQLKPLTTPYWSLPLIAIAANDYLLWQKHQDNFTKERAKEELLIAYQKGQDDVQLESARSDYEAIRQFLNLLQNN